MRWAAPSPTALRSLRARGDHEGLKALVRDAVNWTFWPSLAGAILILALGKPLLWLFNPEFTAAYPVMFVLAIGFLVRASMGPAEFVLNMLGEQGLCALVLVVSAVLDVALSFALVPAFGMLGAAAATSIALVTAALHEHHRRPPPPRARDLDLDQLARKVGQGQGGTQRALRTSFLATAMLGDLRGSFGGLR